MLIGCPSTTNQPPVSQAKPQRIEITSDKSFLLTRVGDTAQLKAIVYMDDGSINTNAVISWKAENADVTVNEQGLITAQVDAGYTYIIGEYQALKTERISVSIAKPAEGTKLVDDSFVQQILPNGTTAILTKTAKTEALNVGDIVISNAGLFGRVTNKSTKGNLVRVQTEFVEFTEAFDKISIDTEGDSVVIQSTFSSQGVETAGKFGKFKCKSKNDSGFDLDIKAGSLAIQTQFTGVAKYEYDKDRNQEVFRTYVRVKPSISLESPKFTASLKAGVEVTCQAISATFPVKVPIASFWGVVTIAAEAQQYRGFRIKATAELSAELSGPKIEGAFFAMDIGLEKNGKGMKPYINFDNGYKSASWGGLDVKVPNLNISITPFHATEVLISFKVTIFDVEKVKLARLELGLPLELEVPLVLNDALNSLSFNSWSYVKNGGLKWSWSVVATASIAIELTGRVGQAMKFFGISNGIAEGPALKLIPLKLLLEQKRPSLSISTNAVKTTGTVQFTLEDVSVTRGKDNRVEFVAYKVQDFTKEPAPLSQGMIIGETVTDDKGKATFSWYPDSTHNGKYLVVGRLYNGNVKYPSISKEKHQLEIDVVQNVQGPKAYLEPETNIALSWKGTSESLRKGREALEAIDWDNLTWKDLLDVISALSKAFLGTAYQKLTIYNVGDEPLRFTIGGSKFNPRNDWFNWLPEGKFTRESTYSDVIKPRDKLTFHMAGYCFRLGDSDNTATEKLNLITNDPALRSKVIDVTVTCDVDDAPSINILSPTANAELSSNVTVQGKITDEGQIKKLTYKLNDNAEINVTNSVQATGEFGFSISSVEFSKGINTIYLFAWDQADNKGEAKVDIKFTPEVPPPPGRDIVVLNDMNPFLIKTHQQDDPMANPNNIRFVQNLVNFTSELPRGQAKTVWIYSGHGAQCIKDKQCSLEKLATFISTIKGTGLKVQVYEKNFSAEGIPTDVKTIFLLNPLVTFKLEEINALKSFAATGGRIVFIGEHSGYYKGISLQNQFLKNMGAVMRNKGKAIDCRGKNEPVVLLPKSSLRTNSITEGLESLSIACASIVELGPDDFALFYDTTNKYVLAGVAAINITPLTNVSTIHDLDTVPDNSSFEPFQDISGNSIE